MPVSQLRVLSVAQWRLLSQLREYLTKGSENGYVFNLTKEWMSLLQRLPSFRSSGVAQIKPKEESTQLMSSSSSTSDSVDVTSTTSNAFDNASKLNAASKNSGNNSPPPSPPSSSDFGSSKYSQVFANLNLFGGENGKSNGDTLQEKTKWRPQKETVSKVKML